MEQNNDFTEIFGAMAGQVIDKALSPQLNAELIQSLKVMYDEEHIGNPENYVEISPYNTASADMQELYFRLPDKMRQEIQDVWGSKRMYVAKDVLAIAFGYKKLTVTKAFLETAEEKRLFEKVLVQIFNQIARIFPEHIQGVHIASTIEDVMKEMAGLAKDNIIVKTFLVSAVNFGSNLMYLKTKRVPIAFALKYALEAFVEGTRYQQHTKERGQLEIELDILLKDKAHDKAKAKELRYRIARLSDKVTKNPTTTFIEAGGMPAVVDDIDTDVVQSNYPGHIEKLVDKATDKIPAPVRNVGKVLMMTQDTAGYKALNNLVKMTDYVGRYVLYQHYQAQGMTDSKGQEVAKADLHDKAMESVIAEFVNFGLPTHKMVEYLNEIGLLWFTKFGLRILKPMYNAGVEKPVDALLTFMFSEHVGLDNIYNSIPGVTGNWFNKIGNPISTLLGSLDEVAFINIIKSIFGK
jgi:hypothetical protein